MAVPTVTGPHPMAVSFLDATPYPQVTVLVAMNTLVWPNTDDPQDAGAAKAVTIDPGGGQDVQTISRLSNDPNDPPQVSQISFTVEYTVSGTYPVKVYASTNLADLAGSAIAETAVVRSIVPGQLAGPELPAVVTGRVVPDLPHFRFPFVRDTYGKIQLVEQGSDDHIYGQEYALVVTPLGWRPERPEYGWPWPEFSMVPLDLEPLRLALKRFVPDSNATVEEWADVASQAVRHVQITEHRPSDTDRTP